MAFRDIVFRSPRFHFFGRRTEEYGLADRQSTDASDRAVVIPALFWFARTTAFSTSGAGFAESGSRFTIEQRTSRIVTVMAGASSPSPK